MEALLRPDERIDDLQYRGLRIIQHPKRFCFGMDAVLLADFARLRPRERVADAGAGTGILSVLLSAKQPDATFEAVELQPDMAEMAARTMRLNGLEARVRVHCLDIREAPERLGCERMDAVVCNPPYGKQGGTLRNPADTLAASRHETEGDLEAFLHASGALLRTHGRLYLCFPAPRFLELCDGLRAQRLEPKQVRMVCARADRAPYLALVEAMKNAKPQLHWQPPLIVYGPDGQPTAELDRIYHITGVAPSAAPGAE